MCGINSRMPIIKAIGRLVSSWNRLQNFKHEDGYRRDNLLATETKEKCNDIYINGIVDALCDGL